MTRQTFICSFPLIIIILVSVSLSSLLLLLKPCSAHPQQQQHQAGGGGLSSGFSNWRPDFGDSVSSSSSTAKNGSTGTAGVTYYWGGHQVGESVLAFSKDRFSSPAPVNAYRTISYQNSQSRISYLEVFVRNAAADQVYVSHGGIGTSFIGVYVGSQSPTTYFEYKATLYGFE